jgi:nitroreductase
MDLFQAIQNRRSCRDFLPDPVPRELIRELLSWAGKAPSAINVQPWEFVVVSGRERERLVRRILQAHREKQVSCGAGTSRPLPEPWIGRQRRLFAGMKPIAEQGSLDLNHFIGEGSCRFYDAPAVIFVFLDRLFPGSRMVCAGMALGYFLLAVQAKGLGTCPIGLINAYEEEIKEQLNVPEDKQLLLGIALGYPDPQAPLNQFKSDRDDIEGMIRWIA